MRSATVFVNDENMALINCPHCESIKQVPVAKFKGEKHTLKAKCACGEVFQVNLNFRKNARKKTDLPGNCHKASEHKSLAVECRIVNLSFRGIGIHLQIVRVALGVHDRATAERSQDACRPCSR